MVRCAASKFALCQLAQPKLATRALLACFRSSVSPAVAVALRRVMYPAFTIAATRSR